MLSLLVRSLGLLFFKSCSCYVYNSARDYFKAEGEINRSYQTFTFPEMKYLCPGFFFFTCKCWKIQSREGKDFEGQSCRLEKKNAEHNSKL